MSNCDCCGMGFFLGDGIYDDGDFICDNCISTFILKSDESRNQSKKHLSSKTKKANESNSISPSYRSHRSKKQSASEISKKAANFVKNIKTMLNKGTGIQINCSNRRAFESAVDYLGMSIDEFHIAEWDDNPSYLGISLKSAIQKEKPEIVPLLLKRPELPKNNIDGF